ncbi:MAG TPA: response regulator [Rhizomicrobium sp.]|nr:response regulator [Rhizomicrobium sp.]
MGLRVLVVEDEGIIAMLLEDMLAELGHDMVASAANIEDARAEAANREIDLAILDVNLGRESSHPLTLEFNAKGIPYILSTGYGRLGEEWGNSVILQKPFEVKALSAAIEKVSERRPAI